MAIRIGGVVQGILGKGIPIKISLINFPKIKEDLERLDKNLEEALLLELNRVGQETSNEMITRFDKTSAYRKPWRKTGNLRYALSGWKIDRSGLKGKDVFTLHIGDRTKLPVYWRWQEKGTKAFTFKESYVPYRWRAGMVVTKHGNKLASDSMPGKPRSYRKTMAERGVKWISYNKAWFASHPDYPKVTLTIRHPGIHQRSFISAGNIYLTRWARTGLKTVLDMAVKGRR